jgi:acetoacetate decarboxylase
MMQSRRVGVNKVPTYEDETKTRGKIVAIPFIAFGDPGYARRHHHVIKREYAMIMYESEPQTSRTIVREPLTLGDSDEVLCECIRRRAAGFGGYTGSGVVISCA